MADTTAAAVAAGTDNKAVESGVEAPAGPALPVRVVTDQEAILNYLFDPHKSFIGAAMPQPVTVPVEPPVPEEHKAAKDIERKAVAAANEGELERALELLNEGVTLAPDYPSVYNNRAQAYRLLKRPTEAFADLAQSIRLGETWLELNAKEFGGSRVFRFVQNVVAQAYSQRAVLNREAGNEDSFQADMNMASKHGSLVAKAIAAQCNPYATLCGDTIKLMLKNPQFADL